MAVYKRSYRGYEGPLTPRWSRFLILSRYAARGIFQSRIITGLFVICFFYPLLMIAGLYLNHNARVLSLMKFNGDHLMDINGTFFMVLMGVQGSMAFLMTAFVGPNMIAPDLANNALPLYFCRPLSRTEYVLGRGAVILFLLSFITWVPGLLIFAIESSLSGVSWASEHWRFAGGSTCGLDAVDRRTGAARAGSVGVGSLEDHRRRSSAGRDVFYLRVCGGVRCSDAD